jgi:hypothetical protein
MNRYPDLELALRATFREHADVASTDAQFDAILDRAARTPQRAGWLAALANPTLRGGGRPVVPTRRMWVFAVVALTAGVLLSVAYLGGPLPMTSPPATALPPATTSPLATPFPYVAGPRRNGKILYSWYENQVRLGTIDPDGSHAATLFTSWGEGGLFAPDGEHIIQSGAIFDVTGRDITVLNLPADPLSLTVVDLSPDGSRYLAYGVLKDAVLAGGTNEAAQGGWYSVRAPDGGDVRRLALSGWDGPARFSPDGSTVAYVSRDHTGPRQLRLVSSTGTDDRILGSLANPDSLDWAPDGRSILATANGDIYSVDIETGVATQIVPESGGGYAVDGAVWSPDGTKILFKRRVGSLHVYDLFTMDASGAHVFDVTNFGGGLNIWFFDWGSHPVG